MIDFPKKAIAYNELKSRLSALYPDNIAAYMDGKKAFTEDCLVEAHTYAEMRKTLGIINAIQK